VFVRVSLWPFSHVVTIQKNYIFWKEQSLIIQSDGIIRAPDYSNSAVEKLPIQLQADGIYGKPKNELLP
jgi:hypothetical protein